MFSSYFTKGSSRRSAKALYVKIVARSRDERFYADYGVPDTLDGRFEMLTMHLFIVLHRLKSGDGRARQVSQHVFDTFIADMDAALREEGVGDQVVPKRIKKMTRVFYGRTGAYEQALAGDDVAERLTETLSRNLQSCDGATCRLLAGYMVTEIDALEQTEIPVLLDKTNLFQGVSA